MQTLDLMNKFITSLVLALIVACSAGQAAQAQQRPEDVAQAYVRAIQTKGLSAIPEFIHPDELARFQKMLLPIVTAPESAMGQNLKAAFFGSQATSESVRAMKPEDFMRGFVRFAENQTKSMNVTIDRSEILGAVREGKTIHLVTRTSVGAGDLKLTQLEVVSLIPYKGSWKLLLTGKLEGMAQALKSQAEKSQ